MEENKNKNRYESFLKLPYALTYERELSLTEKCILAEIISLTMVTGRCYASNSYFAKTFTISEKTVYRALTGLKSKGYISLEMKEKYSRLIRLEDKLSEIKDFLSRSTDKLSRSKDKMTTYNNNYNNNKNNSYNYREKDSEKKKKRKSSYDLEELMKIV